MATVDTCTTSKEGWTLVHHFLGNILCVIRLVVSSKKEGWESVVSDRKTILVGHLRKIVQRMADHGHAEDSVKIDQIRQMVEEGDLTNPAVIDAIFAKHDELDVDVGAMRKKVEELFGKKQ